MNGIKWALHSHIYTQHTRVEEDWDILARDAQEGGFTGVQLYLRDFDSPHQADALRETFSRRGVDVIGANFNCEACDVSARPQILREIELRAPNLAAAGGTILSLGTYPQPEREKTSEDYDAQAATIAAIGDVLARHGMHIAYHAGPRDVADDCRELNELIARLPDTDFRLGPDFGWVARGGMSPAEFVLRFPDRIDYMHLRDTLGDRWTETIGSGEIDWDGLGRALSQVSFAGWVCVEPLDDVELKFNGSLMEVHRHSRQYLQDLWR